MSDFLARVHILDIVIFLLVIFGSLGIGVFYSFSQKSSKEYLQGRREMGLVPVSISMMVSFISAITMQGVPAEVYSFGLYQYLPSLVGAWGSFVTIWTFLPLYYNLKLISIFQYLELRYKHKGPALLGAIFNIAYQSFFMGIATIGPAQILQSLINTPTWVNILIMTAVCTIYTSIGGIKAVVWADVLQAVIMFMGITAVIIIGLFKLDGSVDIWMEMETLGKLDVNWSPSPFVRNNVWVGSLSLAITNWNVYASQSAMMRFNALKSIDKAKITIVVGTLGFVALSLLCAAAAVVMIGYYSQAGCDPLASEELYSPNQLLVYFVTTVMQYPGVPGLFVAAIVSSTLSSVSSVQNGLCAVTWRELLSRVYQDVPDRKKTFILKITVVVYGVLSLFCAYFADIVGGTLFKLSNAALSVLGGGFFGMFLLGAIFPFVGPWSAMIACVVSMVLSLWVSIGSLLYPPNWVKPVYISENCNLYTNISISATEMTHTLSSSEHEEKMGLFDNIYSISPFLYSALGTGSCVLAGLLLSIIPSLRQKGKVHGQYLFPFAQKLFNIKPYLFDDQKDKNFDNTSNTSDDEKKERETQFSANEDISGSKHKLLTTL